MRALVVLAVLGVCSAFPFIPDDPEVAAEKARFFKTFKIIEGATSPRGSGIGLVPSVPQQLFRQPRPQPKWTGPLASDIPASLPGSTPFVSNTPEVNSARANFFNTYKAQIAATVPRPGSPAYYYTPNTAPAPVYSSAPHKKWTGPLASAVPASLPGSSPVVFDTPEVASAKANFLDTYKRQVAAVVPSPY